MSDNISTDNYELKYIYSSATGEFLRTQEVQYDHHGVEIKYLCETRIEPPEFRQLEIPIFNESLNRWDIVEDHRGREVYLNGKEWKKWSELGSLPSGTTTHYVDGASTLEEARLNTIGRIKTYRDAAKTSAFEYNGNVFDCDQNSFMTMSAYESSARASLASGSEFTPVTWITRNNAEVSLTANDFIGLMEAYGKHSTRVNDRAVFLKTIINNVVIPDGNTPLEVREREAIDTIENYDLSFREVVPEGCDPYDASRAHTDNKDS